MSGREPSSQGFMISAVILDHWPAQLQLTCSRLGAARGLRARDVDTWSVSRDWTRRLVMLGERDLRSGEAEWPRC
jgi:hypothetical protein